VAAMPASFYRRLAEVIDGLRSGENAWFVLEGTPPFNPLTTPDGETGFKSEEEANGAAAAAPGGRDAYVVVGPCKTQREVSRLAVTSVTTRDLRNNVATRSLHQDVDMLVWSMSAFDKFVAPYYHRLYGSGQQASEQLSQLRRRVHESGIFGHKWPTNTISQVDALLENDPFLPG
jgi:hypothetical protein